MSAFAILGNVARRRTRCPRCDIPLATVKSGELMLVGCGACRGVWVDRKALEKFSRRDPEARKFGAAREARGGRGAKQNLKCPICYHWMEAKNFENCAELEVDVCGRHGTWLDANELKAVLMFVKDRKAGGSVMPAPHPGPLCDGVGELKAPHLVARPSIAPLAAVGGAAVATSVVAATNALNSPKSSEQNRSAFEGAGDLVMELAEFIPDLGDLGDIGDLGEVVGGVAEIGFSLLSGLG